MARALFIRGFNSSLHKQVKVEAALQGTTIKKVVEKACRAYLKEQTERRDQDGGNR